MKFYLILFAFCVGLGQSGLSQSQKPHRIMIKDIRKECENDNSDIKRFQNSEEKYYQSINHIITQSLITSTVQHNTIQYDTLAHAHKSVDFASTRIDTRWRDR